MAVRYLSRQRLSAGAGVDRRQRSREPVSAFGDRFDVLAVVSRIAQRLAEGKDVVGQIRLFDEGVGPDLVEELLLGD